MYKVLVVLHDGNDYIRMNKVYFENIPVAGQYIIHSDGLAYAVEEVTSFAGYVSSKGATTILIVHQAQKDAAVNKLYGMNIESDLDDPE
ncbi:LysR family transcriptional regulator [Loigolactobacillus backii]|uniref:LysR family transcriptional regulator n=1 Tax=Loigolactobacillus backii TaxID=375175 RepID=A0A192H3X2_9LACO|nr:LysR family transcriptional regulator [Loigolactobacillus backii]ANK59351.1 LysR family transcriptional regulator [Loigolactobacillus backii]ANK63070.1 LysR family transcriptional regulator [Loigolactobacillus backii]ANK64344.1 LysR family transcriptional regulator [Loigolactobacillus backii]ANK67260.1 LysR family transcriptional regulator [Loigolactobacillus backii]ANK69922.1 LysR family transcriptional regulator [Loigolactobacillus backii]